ncbi:MAG: chromosomal replication initiator protein DnaA [Bacteroidetes bacterium]|nr:chromosomal replication initiator protein DnaA [Bacteroidota bacterium]
MRRTAREEAELATVDRDLWQRIIEDVVSNGGNIIRPWFTQLDPIALDGGLLEIQAPGHKEQEYCQQHARDLFTEAAQNATGRLVGVCFLTRAQRDELDETSVEAAVDATTDTGNSVEGLDLSDEYTFDSFVTGRCNRLAHAACMAVSDSPGRAYNPLFVHGASGLGKTHLLNATCRKVLADAPGARIQLLSCETFVNHFIEAVESGDLNRFRYRYRHVDVLAIDDIQFLADHEQSQEEFFHTFNTLYQSQKQIILSSDRGPSETRLEERLVSRFNWGMVARIDRPCYETRVAIVRKKARQRQIILPEDVVCFIAGSIESNTRELEGAIAKVAMLSKVTDRNIDLGLASEALGGVPAPPQREITIDDILNVVTQRYNVRLIDLQSKKRTRSIALPRQICMYLARSLTRHSLEEIGGYFGGRDHTTVLHANRAVESLRDEDPQFQATIEKLTEDIQAHV